MTTTTAAYPTETIANLRAAGLRDDAEWLRGLWESLDEAIDTAGRMVDAPARFHLAGKAGGSRLVDGARRAYDAGLAECGRALAAREAA
jgi:hypothetical protein